MNRLTMMRMFTLLVLVALTTTMLSACIGVEGFGQDVRATGSAVHRTADDAKSR